MQGLWILLLENMILLSGASCANVPALESLVSCPFLERELLKIYVGCLPNLGGGGICQHHLF